MRKIASLLLITALSACGGGTVVEPPKPQVVKLSNPTNLPVPFVVGPSGTVPVYNVPVVGPSPVAQLPFVIGPINGPIAVIDPPVVVGPTRITQPTINYCTDGFVVGPCTPLPATCKPDTSGFVVGPCGG